MPRHHRARLLWLAALALALAGCGDDNGRKPVYPVTGKILVGKKPAAGAVVGFHPAGEVNNPRAVRALATAEKDGTFRLTTYESYDGAPQGDYVVTVYWPGPLPKNAHPGDVGPDRLKGRYANPRASSLRATVNPGENELAPFDLPAP